MKRGDEMSQEINRNNHMSGKQKLHTANVDNGLANTVASMDSSKPHLLFYAHYYYPDTASTGQIIQDLAEGMLDTFRVTVICVVPSYLGTIEDKWKTQKYYFENINGVDVVRVAVPEFTKSSKKSRVKNILAYFFRAMKATGKVGKVDYVMSVSQPPILGGLLGVWGKWTLKSNSKERARYRNLIYNHAEKVQQSGVESGDMTETAAGEVAVSSNGTHGRHPKYRNLIYLYARKVQSYTFNSGGMKISMIGEAT